jgi:UDP-N-acetylglucosamine:LPS N-acetylglucosamine transferase
MRKKVLILSEAFGNGHTKAAEALAQVISLQEPSVQIHIIEIGKMLHPAINDLVLRIYKQSITTFSFLWKKIYDHLSKPNHTTPNWLQSLIYQLLHRNLDKVLKQIDPDIVICTHPFSSSSLSRLKRRGYQVRLCTVITDFHVHQVWAQPEVDIYMASNEEVLRQLVLFGISEQKIVVTGIPVKSDFWQKLNKLEARKSLHLKNLPTVLVMGGGLGLGGIKDIADALIKWKDDIQFIICTGSNQALKTSLENNVRFRHPHIVILGYVNIIHQLLDAADVLITKPGGLTCFEALTKGIPMLIYGPIPGHEEYNCEHLVGRDLAIQIRNKHDVDSWIEKLLLFPEAFKGLYENIKQFQQKNDPLAGAKVVLDLLAR